jgi:hypothetical protein
MRPSLAIGDFSRATHLSVKMPRHYHRSRPAGRVTWLAVSAAELATTVRTGPHKADIDRAYGALATYVTQNAPAIDVVSQDLEDIPNPVAGRTSRGRRP